MLEQIEELHAVIRLGNDTDIAVHGEGGFDTRPEEDMVVGDGYPDLLRRHVAARHGVHNELFYKDIGENA
jgi:hypothetical protein